MSKEKDHACNILSTREGSNYPKIPVSSLCVMTKAGRILATNINKHWYEFFRRGELNLFRMVALLTALVFTTTTAAWGQAAVPVPSFSKLSRTAVIPGHIEVPSRIGRLQREHRNEQEGPFIIYIQDAHAIVDAQNNIRELIAYFQEKYGISLIVLEGGQGRMDPTLFRNFPDAFIKEQVLRDYLRRGELTGVDLAAILNAEPAYFYGMEDWHLYEQNHAAYLRATQVKEAAWQRLRQIRNMLDGERDRVYTPQHREFQRQLRAFELESAHLFDFLKYLAQVGRSLISVPDFTTRYPHLATLMGSIAKESSNKRKSIDMSLRQLAEAFQSKYLARLEPAEQKVFNAAYQAYRVGQKAAADFLKYLVDTGQSVGLKPHLTPVMKELLRERETLSMIRGTRVFDELREFITEVEKGLITNEAERELSKKYKKLRLLEELVDMELVREQWDELEPAIKLAKRLGRSSTPARRFDFLVKWLTELWPLLAPAIRYYEIAIARDSAFYRNLSHILHETGAEAAVVLTGGFHTSGVEQALRDSGYSYAVVTPRIESMKGRDAYERIMKGSLSYRPYLKDSFYEAFAWHASLEFARRLDQPNFYRTIKLWRDNIIRELAKQGRVSEAGKYTRFVDQLFKTYYEKYGYTLNHVTDHETILKDIERELETYRKHKIQSLWNQFKKQFEMLRQEIHTLAERQELNVENLRTVFDKAAQAKATLAMPELVLFPEAVPAGWYLRLFFGGEQQLQDRLALPRSILHFSQLPSKVPARPARVPDRPDRYEDSVPQGDTSTRRAEVRTQPNESLSFGKKRDLLAFLFHNRENIVPYGNFVSRELRNRFPPASSEHSIVEQIKQAVDNYARDQENLFQEYRSLGKNYDKEKDEAKKGEWLTQMIKGGLRLADLKIQTIDSMIQALNELDKQTQNADTKKELEEYRSTLEAERNTAQTYRQQLEGEGVVAVVRIDLKDLIPPMEQALKALGARTGEYPEVPVIIKPVPADEMPVQIDPSKFREILSNLVINSVEAIRHTKKGSEVNVELTVLRDTSEIELRVQDNGPGLPQGWEPGLSSKTGPGEHGIGTSAAQQIITEEWHGKFLYGNRYVTAADGIVKVHYFNEVPSGEIPEGAEVRGAVFAVRLPLARSEGRTAVQTGVIEDKGNRFSKPRSEARVAMDALSQLNFLMAEAIQSRPDLLQALEQDYERTLGEIFRMARIEWQAFAGDLDNLIKQVRDKFGGTQNIEELIWFVYSQALEQVMQEQIRGTAVKGRIDAPSLVALLRGVVSRDVFGVVASNRAVLKRLGVTFNAETLEMYSLLGRGIGLVDLNAAVQELRVEKAESYKTLSPQTFSETDFLKNPKALLVGAEFLPRVKDHERFREMVEFFKWLGQYRSIVLPYEARTPQERIAIAFHEALPGKISLNARRQGQNIDLNKASRFALTHGFQAILPHGVGVILPKWGGNINLSEVAMAAQPSFARSDAVDNERGFLMMSLMVLGSPYLMEWLEEKGGNNPRQMTEATFQRLVEFMNDLAKTQAIRQAVARAA